VTDPHPSLGAWIVAQTRVDTPTTDSTTPSGSNRDASGLRDSGITNHPTTNATRTIGTLTRNTDPHPNCESSTPPNTGPSAIPRPAIADHTPRARPRSLGSVKTLVTTATDVGRISAAPIPMTARHATSAAALADQAAAKEAAPNTISPTRSTR